MADSVLKNKSYSFALKIVTLSRNLQAEKVFVLSKQIMSSGTAIGALIREAEYAQSKLDFIHKLSIALKEANETEYWLNIMKDTNYIDDKIFYDLSKDCSEIIALLVSSIKTAKKNVGK